MAPLSIGSVTNQPQVSAQLSLQSKAETPNIQEIDKSLKAEGKKEIGEKAFQEAIDQIAKRLSEKNVLVSSEYDAKTGMQKMTISHIETGKKIAELPPEAAVEIAENGDKGTGTLSL
jgi:uncharacterized FlaG/YvyC family protein